jgi:undecaprenyl-diphosphatase
MNKKDTDKTKLFTTSIVSLIILFFILVGLIVNNITLPIDLEIYRIIISLYSEFRTEVFITFTTIWGTYWVIFITLIVTTLLILKKKYIKYAIMALINPAFIYTINELIKLIVQRPRPNIFRIIPETWYSFPSWHTMQAVALYWLVIILSSQFIKYKWLRITIYTISSIMIIWIATSRIYLWVHYFSDIIWGILVSTIYLITTKHFLFKKRVA